MLNRAQLPWMVYGAYGVTGRLIVEEALRRGHRPVLAGRDAARLQPMAQKLGLEFVAVSLDDAHGLRGALSHVRLVVHAVGPYFETASRCFRPVSPLKHPMSISPVKWII